MSIPNWDNISNINNFKNLRIKMKFRLKELRKSKNISQLRLSIDLCTSQNSISRFESGVRKPDYDMLIQMADYFDVSLDYLVGRSDNPDKL